VFQLDAHQQEVDLAIHNILTAATQKRRYTPLLQWPGSQFLEMIPPP
jgi:hypothetical protein